MIKAIIFDCFSVLIGDASKMAMESLEQTSPEKAEQFRSATHAADKGIITEEEAGQVQASLLGISEDELRELRRRGETRNVELIEYIKNSLKGHYKLALVSNVSSRARLDSRFLPGELDELFNVVIASGDVGCTKPQPEIYYLAAARLGVMEEECVMLDDIMAYCEGAREVGMNAIQFKTTAQGIADLEHFIDRGGKSY